MYKVLKDFTTPQHRFKAYPANPDHAVISAADIDGPLGVDHYLANGFIAVVKPPVAAAKDKPKFAPAFSDDRFDDDQEFDDPVTTKPVKDKKP